MFAYNILAYCLYLPATYYITIVIGKNLNRHGLPFLMNAFHQQELLVQTVNKFLLYGYYLVNLGYASISINFFGDLTSYIQLFEILVFRLGILLMGLGILHYFNLFIFASFTPTIQKLFSIHSPINKK
ncbi:MAG: hypothetical protein SGJ00_01915 [bacterium]|nr:hypothetical protein [bacterium]